MSSTYYDLSAHTHIAVEITQVQEEGHLCTMCTVETIQGAVFAPAKQPAIVIKQHFDGLQFVFAVLSNSKCPLC